MIGIAQIQSHEGGGVYKISQVFYDLSGAAISTQFLGFQNVTATDLVGREDRAIDSLVQFNTQEETGGTVYPLITDIRGLPQFPSGDGTYWLKLVMVTGVPTLSWGETIDECPEP